ncbi:Homeodomain-like protein [Artemisia annua]|uniref:Homeodomain-like protein n=1 Tax=Artemisia annua TaxID=35608 RepID=A0A2U1KZN6_ARTAN|nr:Homeodomain-like protein [Artemisia annua]
MTEEVVDFVKYGITLSKERLSDLFKEAVWPRLKAEGWHSEKPISSRNNNLVFLAPGVKKYTRRGQKKGCDYFESFFDVMLKVASMPQLLEPNLCQGMLVHHQHAKQGPHSSFCLEGQSSKACKRKNVADNETAYRKQDKNSNVTKKDDANESLLASTRKRLRTDERLEARVSGSNNLSKKMRSTQENSPMDILAEVALADW